MLTAKTYPLTRPVIHSLFFRGAPSGGKSIPSITGKAAGTIPPVVGIPLPFHGNLFAVVKLRDTADAQRERDVQHGALQVGAFQRHESRSVVVVRHHRDSQGVRIEG